MAYTYEMKYQKDVARLERHLDHRESFLNKSGMHTALRSSLTVFLTQVPGSNFDKRRRRMLNKQLRALRGIILNVE